MVDTSDLNHPQVVPPRRSVRRVILGSPRPVWILVAGVFVNRAGSYFSTFLALFLKQIGFTLDELPAILLLVGLVTPLGSMLGGWLSDHYSRKYALVGTTLMSAVGLLVIAVSPNKQVAVAGVAVAALFAQSYLPAASALLVDNTAIEDRVPIFALFRLLLNLGAALGPVLAIAILPHGLHLLFVVSSACSVAFAVVLFLGLPSTADAALDPDGEPADSVATAAAPAAFPWRVMAFLGATLVITMVYIQYSSSVSLAVSHRHTATAYATLLVLNAALVILIELPLSSWTRRLPWWIPVLLGSALMAVGIAVSGAFSSFTMVLVGVLLWTVGEVLFSPVAATAVAALAPPGRLGRYQGYLTTTQAFGFALGPAIGTLVYALSPGALWTGCVLLGTVACLAYSYAGRERSALTQPTLTTGVPT